MKLRNMFVGSLLAAASWQALACYTVYDANSRVMDRSDDPPVDMRRPLHETVPERFPGGQMVFDDSSCASLPMAPISSRLAGRAPLLTNRRTAQSIGVPYRLLSRDVAVIAPSDAVVAQAALPSGITVVAAGHSVAMGAQASARTAHLRRPTRQIRPARNNVEGRR